MLEYKKLSQTEVDLVASILQSNPVLKKYFDMLAHNTALDLALTGISFEEAPEQYIRKQMLTKGKLDVLGTLAEACTPSSNPEALNS